MSKIIKPSDKELFESVRSFRKKPLPLNLKPTGEERAPKKPTSAPKNNPHYEHVPEEPTPADLLAEARRQAEEIVGEAERRAEEIRERAREQGRTEGFESATKTTEKHLEASSQMLASFTDQMKARESELIQTLTPKLANLATDLARKIIHREIEGDSSVVTSQAEEAISKILEREKLIIRVNPSDEELMKYHKEALGRMFDGIDKIEVIGDANVERGGCIVETNLIKVDAQPGSQLEFARKTLMTEAEQ